MTILRTVCPACDIVRVKAENATLRHHDDDLNVEVDFTCPGCDGHVVQQLNARMLPLLVSAGCHMADAAHAGVGGEISESEIREFVESLDRIDWADELEH